MNKEKSNVQKYSFWILKWIIIIKYCKSNMWSSARNLPGQHIQSFIILKKGMQIGLVTMNKCICTCLVLDILTMCFIYHQYPYVL